MTPSNGVPTRSRVIVSELIFSEAKICNMFLTAGLLSIAAIYVLWVGTGNYLYDHGATQSTQPDPSTDGRHVALGGIGASSGEQQEEWYYLQQLKPQEVVQETYMGHADTGYTCGPLENAGKCE